MALSKTEKDQIEVMIRKEIKDFMNATTVKQFENKLIDELKKEIKNHSINEKDLKTSNLLVNKN